MCDDTQTLLVAGAGALMWLIETWLGYSECRSNSIVEATMSAFQGCRKANEDRDTPYPLPPPSAPPLDDGQV